MPQTTDQVEIENEPLAGDERIEVRAPRRRAFLEQTFGERVRAFWWGITWALFFRRTPGFMRGWRNTLLRMYGADVGRDVHVHPSARIHFPWNLYVGNDVVIEHSVIVNCMGAVRLGDRTQISQYAHLVAGTHAYERRDMRIIRSPITIGKDVWIAADAFVGPGVSIGNGSLLAARSSAFKALPGGMVCVGEPARPVKPRDLDRTADEDAEFTQ